jgi:hypothetical protein
MLCAVYTVQMETRSIGFLVESQNQGRWFVNGLASKPLGRFLPVWLQDRWRRFISALASKPLGRVSGLGLKIKQNMVCRLCHKTDGGMKMVWDTH